jgi:hypothetical protein
MRACEVGQGKVVMMFSCCWSPAQVRTVMERGRRLGSRRLAWRLAAGYRAHNHTTTRPSDSIPLPQQGVPISGLSNPIVCQNVDGSNTTQLIIPTMKYQGSVSRGSAWDVLVAPKPTN